MSDHINDYLGTVRSTRLDTHGTLDDATADDYVTVTVDDRGTHTNLRGGAIP